MALLVRDCQVVCSSHWLISPALRAVYWRLWGLSQYWQPETSLHISGHGCVGHTALFCCLISSVFNSAQQPASFDGAIATFLTSLTTIFTFEAILYVLDILGSCGKCVAVIHSELQAVMCGRSRLISVSDMQFFHGHGRVLPQSGRYCMKSGNRLLCHNAKLMCRSSTRHV